MGTFVGDVVINCRLTTRSTTSPSGSPEQSRIASFTDKGGAEWARYWHRWLASNTSGIELPISNHSYQENDPGWYNSQV